MRHSVSVMSRCTNLSSRCSVCVCVYVDSDRTLVIMQVVEKKGNQDEKMLSTKVALLLGKGSLKDFEAVREAEVNDFRATMIERCREAIEARNKFSWEQKVLYHYPPDIESSAEISQLVADRLSPQVCVCVCVLASRPGRMIGKRPGEYCLHRD